MARKIGGEPILIPPPPGHGRPLIPFDFDQPGKDFEEHLTHEDVEGGQKIGWATIGKSFFLPFRTDGSGAVPRFVDHETIESANPLLKLYGLGGFSLGDFHEFFVQGAPVHRAYRFGKVEVSFGEGTPLLAKLFWNYYYEKYWGPWDQTESIRISGCPADLAERYLIAACLEYEQDIGLLPEVMQIDLEAMLGEDINHAHSEDVIAGPAAITDLEPLRFYYSGMSAQDPDAACLSYYRVLEYYAFMAQADEIVSLRRDKSVSDAEFSRRAAELATRDEKGPLFRLLSQLSTKDIRDRAKADGLISDSTQNRLSEEIYAYRNAIVHGKFGSSFKLKSRSVLIPNYEAGHWRALLKELAWTALTNFGSKD